MANKTRTGVKAPHDRYLVSFTVGPVLYYVERSAPPHTPKQSHALLAPLCSTRE